MPSKSENEALSRSQRRHYLGLHLAYEFAISVIYAARGDVAGRLALCDVYAQEHVPEGIVSIEKAVRLVCNNEHGYGDVFFPDTEVFDPKYTNARHLRREARKAGWRRLSGGDYCPICVPSVFGLEDDE